MDAIGVVEYIRELKIKALASTFICLSEYIVNQNRQTAKSLKRNAKTEFSEV